MRWASKILRRRFLLTTLIVVLGLSGFLLGVRIVKYRSSSDLSGVVLPIREPASPARLSASETTSTETIHESAEKSERQPRSARCLPGKNPEQSYMGGSSFSDIDGDGSDDEIYLRLQRNGSGSCHLQIHLLTDSEQFEIRMVSGEEVSNYELSSWSTLELNNTSGTEIILPWRQGATGGTYQGFAFHRGGLVKLQTEDGKRAQLPGYASLGAGDIVDCRRPGLLIQTTYTRKANSAKSAYSVTRSVFRINGGIMRKVHTKHLSLSWQQLTRLPGMDETGEPFQTCSRSM
jgi:hypothetical protein